MGRQHAPWRSRTLFRAGLLLAVFGALAATPSRAQTATTGVVGTPTTAAPNTTTAVAASAVGTTSVPPPVTTGDPTTGSPSTGSPPPPPGNTTTGVPPDSSTSDDGDAAGTLFGFEYWQVGVAGGVVLLILIGICVGIVICVKRRNAEASEFSSVSLGDMEDFNAPPSFAGSGTMTPTTDQFDSDLPDFSDAAESAAADAAVAALPPPVVPQTKRDVAVPGREWEIDASELEFGECVGIGSFGTVYRGQWRGEEVAIKVIRAEDGSFDTDKLPESHIEEFSSEAKVMTQIPVHENVCRLIAVTTVPFVGLILEFMDYGSAYEYMKAHGAFDKALAYRIIGGMALGLAHLHEYDIVHRDFAARNVMLDKTMKATIADFGMSRKLVEGDEDFGKSEEDDGAPGPLKHMAPESIAKKEFSIRSDVWAFGITVFEIATGKEPHAGMPAFQVAMFVAESGLTPDFPAGRDDLDEAQEVMKWCCQKGDTDRPTMAEVAPRCQSLS